MSQKDTVCIRPHHRSQQCRPDNIIRQRSRVAHGDNQQSGNFMALKFLENIVLLYSFRNAFNKMFKTIRN